MYFDESSDEFENFECCICLSKNEYVDCDDNESNHNAQSNTDNLKIHKDNHKCIKIKDELQPCKNIRDTSNNNKTSTFNKILKLNCGHQFHVNCIDKWINEKFNCPLCRKEFDYILYDFEESIQNNFSNIDKISKFNESQCHKYKFNISKKKKINLNIDNQTIKISNAFQQLINQKPTNYKINKSSIYYPVYFVFPDNFNNTIPNKKIYISFYLRQLILWNRVDKTQIYHYTDLVGNKIFCSRQNINEELTKHNFIICYEWIYDVMCEFKRLYNFNYYSELNTLILDIFVKTIKDYNNITKCKLQTVIISTLYNVIKLYYPNKLQYITKELLVQYTNNSSNIKNFNKFQSYQETNIFSTIDMIC